MFDHTLIVLASISLIGVACQWLAWWLKLPAILFLLLAGIVAGPVTGFLRPDALFGDLLFPIISLGVAVVLFEGSLTLKLHEITGLGGVVRNLVACLRALNSPTDMEALFRVAALPRFEIDPQRVREELAERKNKGAAFDAVLGSVPGGEAVLRELAGAGRVGGRIRWRPRRRRLKVGRARADPGGGRRGPRRP